MHIIQTTSKINHGLVFSDVLPKDRQNFSSCQKICKEEVLELLRSSFKDVPGANGTYVYLKLIQSVMIAYHDRNIYILDRLYHAWLSVFICRLWFAWLDMTTKEKLQRKFSDEFSMLCRIVPSECLSKFKSNSAKKKKITKNKCNEKSKQYFTITRPSYLSIEINANSLTYLILLAVDGQIPRDTLSNIQKFNSQSCENVFRSARAMSGVYSNVVNFTVADFLRRADKISAVQSIQTESESSTTKTPIRFPKHHKEGKDAHPRISFFINSSFGRREIDEVVKMAFDAAYDLIKPLIDEKLFRNNKYHTLEGLCKFTFKSLNSSKLKNNPSESSNFDDYQSDGLVDEKEEFDTEDEDEDESDDDEPSEKNEDMVDSDGSDDDGQSKDIREADNQDDATDDVLDRIVVGSLNTSFHGLLAEEQIAPSKISSFFKVRRDDEEKFVYISKSTACWILTKEKNTLSSDRLKRVTQ